MAWWNFNKKEEKTIDESIKSFTTKGEEPRLTPKQIDLRTGEGVEDLNFVQGYGVQGLSSFNQFYSQYINPIHANEVQKIKEYRSMAAATEIADVIEDATNEAIVFDSNDQCVFLTIKDKDLVENENISKNINDEFKKFFYDNIQIQDHIWDYFWSYMIDGRLFFERIINKGRPSEGIISIKKLPAESMDYIIEPRSGKITNYFQFLTLNKTNFKTIEEAEKDPNIVVFNPEQISFISYGIYGSSKKDILGFLDKAKIPHNQLKLLETSVVIYRLVRSPERFVFRIDTGNMPMSKAMAFVEKIKTKMNKKQTYNPSSGQLTQEPEILNLLENYYLPQCLSLNTKIDLIDGRTLTLQEIIDERNQDNNSKQQQVYSIDQETGEKKIGEIEWAGITRKNTDLIRVHLDNGTYEDVTPDHKFCVWNKKKDNNETMKIIEVEAQHLTEDMDIVD